MFLKRDWKSLIVKSFTRTNVFIFSVKFFRVTDWGVGAVSAVKIRLTQKGYYKDFWYLEQVNIFELASVSIFLYIQERTTLEPKELGRSWGRRGKEKGEGTWGGGGG